MMERCFVCGRDMGPVVLRLGDALPILPSRMIYPSTSKGTIAFCDLCFEAERFGELTPEDVETVTWFFGVAYVDDDPARAVELLEPMLSKWRAPDLLSPLGRAYLSVGRAREGLAMREEALSLNAEHPWASEDRLLLENEGA
jgi:hypothetical protein